MKSCCPDGKAAQSFWPEFRNGNLRLTVKKPNC
jgi:hypothetical protein